MDPNTNPYRDEPAPKGPNAIGPVGQFLIATLIALLACYLGG